MKKVIKENRPTHISKENVLDDLGFSPEERAALNLKIEIHNEIMKIIEKKKISPRELEAILKQPQSRVSELLTGKLSVMSAEKLVGYMWRLGVAIKVSSKKASSDGLNLRKQAAF